VGCSFAVVLITLLCSTFEDSALPARALKMQYPFLYMSSLLHNPTGMCAAGKAYYAGCCLRLQAGAMLLPMRHPVR
jgi:hypothetical protein